MPESRILDGIDYLPLSTSKGYLKSEDSRRRWIPVFTGMTEPVDAGSRCWGTTCRAPAKAVRGGLFSASWRKHTYHPRKVLGDLFQHRGHVPVEIPYLAQEDELIGVVRGIEMGEEHEGAKDHGRMFSRGCRQKQ